MGSSNDQPLRQPMPNFFLPGRELGKVALEFLGSRRFHRDPKQRVSIFDDPVVQAADDQLVECVQGRAHMANARPSGVLLVVRCNRLSGVRASLVP